MGAAAFSNEQKNYLLDQIAALLTERGANTDSEDDRIHSKEESDSDSSDVEEIAGYSNRSTSNTGQHGTPFWGKGNLPPSRNDTALSISQ